MLKEVPVKIYQEYFKDLPKILIDLKMPKKILIIKNVLYLTNPSLRNLENSKKLIILVIFPIIIINELEITMLTSNLVHFWKEETAKNNSKITKINQKYQHITKIKPQNVIFFFKFCSHQLALVY